MFGKRTGQPGSPAPAAPRPAQAAPQPAPAYPSPEPAFQPQQGVQTQAFAFNAAQGGARLTSTATTGGVGNPILSLIEDVLAFFTVILAFLAPILVPVVLIVLAVLVFRLARRLREKLYTRDGLTADATRLP